MSTSPVLDYFFRSTMIKQLIYSNQTVLLFQATASCPAAPFSHHCSHLDNGFLFKTMSSWPHICLLELMDLHFHSPDVTFCRLFAALCLCPCLQTLQIFVDAVYINIDPTTESFEHTSLQALDLNSPDIVDAKAVARTIISMNQ